MARAIFLCLLATLRLICFSSAIGFTNITSDQAALLTLKAHISSSNVLAQNWSTTTSVCNWIGVTCGSRHHRVIALKLPDLRLAGTIPPQLGNLSFLVHLNISNNSFHGTLPEELSGLRRLRVFAVAQNKFSGHIPPSLFQCLHLKVLVLSDNGFGGAIPNGIGKLKMLEWLDLRSNNLGGSIPREIGNLSMLNTLGLMGNHLKGVIPQEISYLYNLEWLDFGNNSLSGSIPMGIFNISTLQSLSLAHNNLLGTLPSTMGHRLLNLENLSLQMNSLIGKIPESISNSSKLSIISLECNQFTGPIPISFGNLRSLTCLHLFENNLTSNSSQELSFITSLTNCRHLKDIIVNGNPLDAVLPASIGNFSSSLQKFQADGCKIKGDIPNKIGNLSNLNFLSLNDNDLSGPIPDTFHGLQNLQGLFLRNNKLRGSFPGSLCDLNELSMLALSLNEISGPILDCIGNRTSLRDISLDSNRLNSSIPLSMWNLKDLLTLNLSTNSFSGSLPQEVGNLKRAIHHMDLSRNQFTGVIPSMFGSMKSLIELSLASNRLQGPIPQSFGEMVNMERLDLSDNYLSGGIPESLERLNLLKYFNVSSNKLRGQIPSEGPFKNFSYLFFMSNEALCGAPQLQVPPCHNNSSHRFKIVTLVLISTSVMIASLILVALLVFSYMTRHKREEVSFQVDPLKKTSFRRFSYQQLQQATAGFSQDNLLGAGSLGAVYKATFQNGLVFAIKVFNLQKKDACKSFEIECEVLGNLRHRNLTSVISACSSLDFKALILEYMQNGSLEDWLHSDSYFLDMMQRLDIMVDVASALEYLHHGYLTLVVHCDLKPSNILLDNDMVGHLTDFSITKLLEDEETSVHTMTLATLGYMAPEYGTQGLVSRASDIYSYGILLMETFTRRKPSDNMFVGDLNIRSWISASVPNGLSQVVDSGLMIAKEEHLIKLLQCVSQIIELALNCTVESPRDRMNLKDVLATLKDIKVRYAAMSL